MHRHTCYSHITTYHTTSHYTSYILIPVFVKSLNNNIEIPSYLYFSTGNFRLFQPMTNNNSYSPPQLFDHNYHPTSQYYILYINHCFIFRTIITIIVSVILRLNRIQYYVQRVILHVPLYPIQIHYPRSTIHKHY